MIATYDRKFYNHRDTEDTEGEMRIARDQDNSLCSLCLCGKQNGCYSSATLTRREVAL